MRKLIILSAFLLTILLANAQQNDLKLKTIYLDNGLKVVMCEDHSQPEIYGAVYVHAGSKNDPSDATGMAHYFEHIMFKGTDKIGTTNWEAEKVYLDSISLMYDKLHDTDDIEARKAIQHKINELSLASTEYAIPNETDVILTQMGGKGLNAGTAYDQTMYFNTFPSNQLEKWMDVYVERFRNPVFRLFQSELETVYEEKNMYSDSPITAFREGLMKEAFGDHPYGRPIIGYAEHLKNPQPSKMREFYNTYYVANNMTLLLVGDFNIEEVEPIVADKFSIWKKGVIPEMPTYTFPKFEGKVVKTVKTTPVKMGVLIFPGVEIGHEDQIPLEMLSAILSFNGTGLFDKIMMDNKVMAAMYSPVSLEDHGVNIIIYMPKIIGQSHEKAENIIMACLDSLKQGKFSDDLFESVKTNILADYIKQEESLNDLASMLLDLEYSGQTYEDRQQEIEEIKNITKEEVITIANKYFGDNYISYRSKMGFPPKDKIEKPDWKPIEAKNTEAKSEFAKAIEAEQIPESQPQTIIFGEDVAIDKVNNSFTMYSAKNPRNDIFEMTIAFAYGSMDDPDFGKAVSYIELQGTKDKSFEEFTLELQKLGASINFGEDGENYTTVKISGFEKDLPTILALCKEKVLTPGNDENKLAILLDEERTNIKFMKDDASTYSKAIHDYALYGDKSDYLRKSSLKELEKFSGQDFLDKIAKAFDYDGYILFSGNTSPTEIIKLVKENNLVKDNAIKGKREIKKENKFTDSQVFVTHNKKFRQSNIRFYVPGEQLSKEDKALCQVFNKYFGTDMYSIVFQEIREFRSLGYTAYGSYSQDAYNRKPGSLFCYLGTQSDKTIDGTTALAELITDMPERIEKFNASKDALIMSRASQYYTFRNAPQAVCQWIEQGYNHDPRLEITNIIKKAEYKDVYGFYERMIKGRPLIITLSGNLKKINKEDLEKFGKITELKYKEIIKE